MDQLPRLNKKVLSVSSLNDIEEEKQFWVSKGAIERIEAIELHRRMVYGENQGRQTSVPLGGWSPLNAYRINNEEGG